MGLASRGVCQFAPAQAQEITAEPHGEKVATAIQNARAFLAVQKEFGSFDAYLWQFVGNKTIDHKIRTMNDIPATSKESDAMSKDLLKRGFKFAGSTICYAFMQAVGIVNDHETRCFRRGVVKKPV